MDRDYQLNQESGRKTNYKIKGKEISGNYMWEGMGEFIQSMKIFESQVNAYQTASTSEGLQNVQHRNPCNIT